MGRGSQHNASARLFDSILNVVVMLAASPSQLRAETAEEFYRGKRINLIVGYGPGGGYDVFARLLARHLGRHIAGSPQILVQNMPGAGSLVAANFLYSVAPRDGTVIGVVARHAAARPARQQSQRAVRSAP